ncbi:LemA family protein [Candidatus Peregrinibacteria bacterium]|nr:MAG: LemA family protein [Candidatus Peregrinibacteria bacterium]
MSTLQKILIALGAGILFFGFIILSTISSSYNTMITYDEEVKTAFSNVENQYQRRSDLIPSLVATVKGAANFEKDTLTAVIEARAKATSTNVNINDATAFQAFQQNQAGLQSALSKLMVVVEQYPELKANQNFRDLQLDISRTENRIATERGRFNETTKIYNTFIRRFPNNFIASWFAFDSAQLFKTTEEAKTVPTIDFNK